MTEITDVEKYLMKNMDKRITDAVEKDGIREEYEFEDLADLADLDSQIKENYAEAMKNTGRKDGVENMVDRYVAMQKNKYEDEEDN